MNRADGKEVGNVMLKQWSGEKFKTLAEKKYGSLSGFHSALCAVAPFLGLKPNHAIAKEWAAGDWPNGKYQSLISYLLDCPIDDLHTLRPVDLDQLLNERLKELRVS